jgi:hypothetical protein
MFTIDDAFGKDIIDSVDNFDESNEDCFEAAAEYLHILVQGFKKQTNKQYYVLVKWPESQMLMEHPRFNECLFVENIEGHNDVGSLAYMCPVDIYKEIFKK